MASTRARLTASYAFVLIGTLIAFSAALVWGRRNRANEELLREVLRTAEGAAALIRDNAQLPDRQLTVVDTANVDGPIVRATKELVDLLTPLSGYFIVLSTQNAPLYSSTPVRALSVEDQTRLLSAAVELTPEVEAARVSVRGDSLSLFVVAHRTGVSGLTNINRIVVAMPATAVQLPTTLLIGTIIALTPLVLLVSVAAAYVVAGRAFKPVDQLINEVEAITDGRSLHRRLPADSSADELSRLGVTVNAMLARLENSFSALRRFTADASHELKTPLTVLRADVERAMHPSTSRTERMVALEEALQETARMADLVDSLLTLARADEGRFDLHRTPVELEPLVREVFETAVILGEHAGLTMELPVLENAIVMGDRTRLRELLLNLVTNAIKYTPRGGRVEMSVNRRGHDEIGIAVRDTGIGIAAADLPHVFERFWRADRARSRASAQGGSGLGLAISHWIVQAHGGTITVQSRLGRGTVFTVNLPVVPLPEAAPAEVVEPAITPPAPSP